MTTTSTPRAHAGAVVRSVLWLGFLTAGHLGLTAAGSTLTGPPPPWEVDAFLEWIQVTDVAMTSFALLRIVGLVIIWYLALLTALVLLARIRGLHPLGILARRLAVPWARQLLNHVLGAGLAVSLAGGIVPVVGATAAMAAPPPIAVAVEHPGAAADADDGAPVRMSRLPDDRAGADGATVTMRRLPDQPPGGDDEVTMRRLPDEPRPAGRSVGRATASMRRLDDTDAPARATWTVAAGDHLWHIASHTLETQWGRPATDAEIATYWQVLIEHNQDRFAVPGDPDLVYPGQVFDLPPVPAPPPAG
jgi:hypothetical protein